MLVLLLWFHALGLDLNDLMRDPRESVRIMYQCVMFIIIVLVVFYACCHEIKSILYSSIGIGYKKGKMNEKARWFIIECRRKGVSNTLKKSLKSKP